MKDPGGYDALHFDIDTDMDGYLTISGESFLNAMARSFQSWSRLLGLVWLNWWNTLNWMNWLNWYGYEVNVLWMVWRGR